jgi:hypothetical protein
LHPNRTVCFAGITEVKLKPEGKMNFNNMFDSLMKQVNQSLANRPMITPLALPHPEEPMAPSANLSNIDASSVMNKWLVDWNVPERFWNYWRNAISLEAYDAYPPSILAMGVRQDTPAATWEAGGKRHLAIKPQWLNPGVIAHEQAHNSYALLAPEQKTEFSSVYTPLKNSDPLIRFLYSRNTYGLSNDVEGHAEVYRYIGDKMPQQLRKFYPLLFFDVKPT